MGLAQRSSASYRARCRPVRRSRRHVRVAPFIV